MQPHVQHQAGKPFQGRRQQWVQTAHIRFQHVKGTTIEELSLVIGT